MLHVGPAADARDYLFPFPCVGENARAAGLIEFRNTIFLDVLFVLKSELFFDDILYRKSVTIPPPHARHMVAAHRPVARYDVLDDACHDMAVVRKAGRKRRAIVENVLAIRRVLFERFLENIPFFPECECFFLARGDIRLLALFHHRIVSEKLHPFRGWDAEYP